MQVLLNPKKVSFYFLLVFMTTWIGCGLDQEEPTPASPTLTIIPSGTATISGQNISATPGQSISFAWSAQIPGGFNVFRIRQSGTTVFERNRNELGLAAGTTSVQGPTHSITFTPDNIGTFEIELSIVDDLNQQDKVTYNVTVSSPLARVYTTVLLFAPLENRTALSFFSSSTGQTHSPQQVTSTNAAISPTIDFGYYYGATDNASLASPQTYSTLPLASQVTGWTKLNNTTFRRTTLNSAAFIETKTWAQIDAAYNAGTSPGTSGGIVTRLAQGQVIAFQTDATKTGGSKKGLILVKNITGTFNQGNNIELEVLVQESSN